MVFVFNPPSRYSTQKEFLSCLNFVSLLNYEHLGDLCTTIVQLGTLKSTPQQV